MNIKLNTHVVFTPELEHKEFDIPNFNGTHTDLAVLNDSLTELISFIAGRMLFEDSLFDDMDFINDIYFELFGNPYIAEYGGKYTFVSSKERMEGLRKVIKAIDYIAAAIEPLRCNVAYERRFYKILIHYKKLAIALYNCAESLNDTLTNALIKNLK